MNFLLPVSALMLRQLISLHCGADGVYAAMSRLRFPALGGRFALALRSYSYSLWRVQLHAVLCLRQPVTFWRRDARNVSHTFGRARSPTLNRPSDR